MFFLQFWEVRFVVALVVVYVDSTANRSGSIYLSLELTQRSTSIAINLTRTNSESFN